MTLSHTVSHLKRELDLFVRTDGVSPLASALVSRLARFLCFAAFSRFAVRR
jgi:hypothetical protein